MSVAVGRRGDVKAAIAVMLEAARWLDKRGQGLWTQAQIQRLPKQYPADAFLTLTVDGQAAVAALLIDTDPLVWPQVPPGTSGFLHKMAVRRAFAGRGLAVQMLQYAAQLCNNEGKSHLRLDCDASREKLIALYQSAGFTCVGVRTLQTKTHGMVKVSRFERALAKRAGLV